MKSRSLFSMYFWNAQSLCWHQVTMPELSFPGHLYSFQRKGVYSHWGGVQWYLIFYSLVSFYNGSTIMKSRSLFPMYFWNAQSICSQLLSTRKVSYFGKLLVALAKKGRTDIIILILWNGKFLVAEAPWNMASCCWKINNHMSEYILTRF